MCNCACNLFLFVSINNKLSYMHTSINTYVHIQTHTWLWTINKRLCARGGRGRGGVRGWADLSGRFVYGYMGIMGEECRVIKGRRGEGEGVCNVTYMKAALLNT